MQHSPFSFTKQDSCARLNSLDRRGTRVGDQLTLVIPELLAPALMLKVMHRLGPPTFSLRHHLN